MDFSTLASTFASVVGLVGLFKAEGNARETRTLDHFIEWLQRHRHEQLVSLIQDNSQILQTLREFIEAQHDEVIAQLQRLDHVLSSVASHDTEFSALAFAIRPSSSISDQSVSILQQLNQATASKFIESKTMEGTTYHLVDGTQGMITIDDARFIDDDLISLCKIGLLRLDYTSQGSRLFIITRAGAAVGG